MFAFHMNIDRQRAQGLLLHLCNLIWNEIPDSSRA